MATVSRNIAAGRCGTRTPLVWKMCMSGFASFSGNKVLGGSRHRCSCGWPSRVRPSRTRAPARVRSRNSKCRLDDFVFRVANGFEIAVEAFGFARDTYAAAVPDQLVRKLDPFLAGDRAHQVWLNFLGIFVLG